MDGQAGVNLHQRRGRPLGLLVSLEGLGQPPRGNSNWRELLDIASVPADPGGHRAARGTVGDPRN